MHARALEYHAQSLALKLELGDTSSEAFSHHNIGLVYQSMGDERRALEAFRRSLEIREALGDERGIAASLNNIGQVEAIENPEAALRTHARALELRRRRGDRRGEAATHDNVGRVLLGMGDAAGAAPAFQRALGIAGEGEAPLLQAALDGVQTLRGLLPICASCKNIRDDNGYWTQVEAYVGAHSAAEFTHSICPGCAEKLYPDVLESVASRGEP